MAALNYHHGRTKETEVSKEQKKASQGLNRRVSFDLDRNVAFEPPRFEDKVVQARHIRPLGKRPSLKLIVKHQTIDEQRAEKQRLEEQRIAEQTNRGRFDEQRGDPVMELMSPDTLKALEIEFDVALENMDVEEDMSDLDLSSTS